MTAADMADVAGVTGGVLHTFGWEDWRQVAGGKWQSPGGRVLSDAAYQAAKGKAAPAKPAAKAPAKSAAKPAAKAPAKPAAKPAAKAAPAAKTPAAKPAAAAAKKPAAKAAAKPTPKPKAEPKAKVSPRGAEALKIARENAGAKPDARTWYRSLAREYRNLHAAGGTPADIAPVEAALVKAGAVKTGTAGDVVPFDGELHTAGVGVSTGAKVKIVRPGWVLREPGGREYHALPAQVELVAAAPAAKPAAGPGQVVYRPGGAPPVAGRGAATKPAAAAFRRGAVGDVPEPEPAKPVHPSAPKTPAPPAAPAPSDRLPPVPPGQTLAGEVPEEGLRVTLGKDGLTTQFAPGEPERQARRLGPAIGQAMDHLKLFDEYHDGFVGLGDLVHQVKLRVPGVTDGEVMAGLMGLRKAHLMEGRTLNETHVLTSPSPPPGMSPVGKGRPFETATLWENQRALHVWAIPPGKTSADLAKPSAPPSAAPTETAAQARDWIKGVRDRTKL